ncbi:hypothetical protein CJ030_MR3G026237 [Morella rubra]|uniref:Uncharacterized protein n=1 Tax=Morella rubra TaxID=262757 RepID=A0A6A1W2K5_9ROSI|nr:hypothetical protein CJ030_MR3G026237 [Morella rubra]
MRSDTDSYLAFVQNEYEADTAEYNTVFGRLVENERGNPSAAKKFVENFLFVELKVEEFRRNAVVCAVFKDVTLLKEKVRKLMCSHYFHGDCSIVRD